MSTAPTRDPELRLTVDQPAPEPVVEPIEPTLSPSLLELAVEPVPVRSTRRELRHRRRRRRIVTGAVVVLGLLAASTIAVLGWKGWNTSQELTGGEAVEYVTDPNAPGYAAEVAPTPVELVILKDDLFGGPVGVWLIAQHGDAGGGVLSVPPNVVVETAYGPRLLWDAYKNGGADELRTALESVLGTSIPQAAEYGSTEFAALVGPAAPIEFTNPDQLLAADGTVLFAAGPIALSAEQVPSYLGARNPGESDTNRFERSQLVWEAWLAKLGENPDALPDDATGVEAFLATMSEGKVDYETMPFDVVPLPFVDPSQPQGAVLYADTEGIPGTVAVVVPFPTSAFPGQRVRVRLLNGTTDPQAPARMASALVPLGAEIALLGNAENFNVSQTIVEYHAPEMAERAQVLADAFGLSAIEASADSATVDVTVVVGQDVAGDG